MINDKLYSFISTVSHRRKWYWLQVAYCSFVLMIYVGCSASINDFYINGKEIKNFWLKWKKKVRFMSHLKRGWNIAPYSSLPWSGCFSGGRVKPDLKLFLSTKPRDMNKCKIRQNKTKTTQGLPVIKQRKELMTWAGAKNMFKE